MMKRSEFGFDEWNRFYANIKHTHLQHCYVYTVTIENDKNKYSGTHSLLGEACRICTEEFCKGYPRDFPWDDGKPNFVSWTQERCEEYILGVPGGAYLGTIHNTQRARDGSGYYALCALVVQIEDETSKQFGNSPVGPQLRDYQAAAEYVWTQVNK